MTSCKKEPPGCEEYLRILQAYANESQVLTRATRGRSSPEQKLANIERWIARQAEVGAELEAVDGSKATAKAVDDVRVALDAVAEVYEATLADLREQAEEDARIAELERGRDDAEKALRTACSRRTDCADILAALAAMDEIPDGASTDEFLSVIRKSVEQIAKHEHPSAEVRKHAQSYAEAKGSWLELAEKLLQGEPSKPSKELIAKQRRVEAQLRTAVDSVQGACGQGAS